MFVRTYIPRQRTSWVEININVEMKATLLKVTSHYSKKALAEGRLDGNDGGPLRMPPICRVLVKVREMNDKAYQRWWCPLVCINMARSGCRQRRSTNGEPFFIFSVYRCKLPGSTWICFVIACWRLRQSPPKMESWSSGVVLGIIIENLAMSAGLVRDYDKDDPSSATTIMGGSTMRLLWGRTYSWSKTRFPFLSSEYSIIIVTAPYLDSYWSSCQNVELTS